MSPRAKYIIIGSIFAVLTMVAIRELIIVGRASWIYNNAIQEDIQAETEYNKESIENNMAEKCAENSDFLYCNP